MNAIESVCYGCVGAGMGGCSGCCNPTSEKFKDCARRIEEYKEAKKLATTDESGRDVTKARCDLLMKRWVDREDVCEFWNKRKESAL